MKLPIILSSAESSREPSNGVAHALLACALLWAAAWGVIFYFLAKFDL